MARIFLKILQKDPEYSLKPPFKFQQEELNRLFNEKELREKELGMFRLINKERRSRNIRPLIFEEEIAKVARSHSKDMIGQRFFSHTNPKGEEFSERLLKASINFTLSGENIAKDLSIEKAHEGLMKSEGHRKNILEPEFTHVGIGILQDQDSTLVITQNFVSWFLNLKLSQLSYSVFTNAKES